ncbi:MAG: metallophosphoesterase [Candidatus Cohnella colombiensis]|uniref:Metallophosphoesterase n=1 Tax=Candidatus Cohnella colombiensis TaxID=3121368 RepID=A0AA95EY68_9BACL|nr:MAG: metallophosphoesterase [Cohnella sp.]
MFIVFILVALVVYSLLVYYIGRSGWSFFKPSNATGWKWIYIGCVVLLSTSFLLGRIGHGTIILQVIGSYWIMLFCLLLLLLPIVHICIWLLGYTRLPRHRVKRVAGIVILITLITCIAYGSYNAYSPVVRTYEIEIENEALANEKLSIVMAADMHFGHLSGSNHAKRLVSQVNALHPDLVLFPGDLIDDDIRPYLNKGIDEILQGIESTYGVYASLGNHDKDKGTMKELIASLERSNMTLLYDESITIADKFTLIGRKDKSDPDRAQLSELLVEVDQTKPLFLLEHQPYELGTAADQGIDLMVSGHTHRGQIAPAHLFTQMIYENDWGYLLKGSMHSIVTSGYGFWGPPIRIGSQSEIVHIIVTFTDGKSE